MLSTFYFPYIGDNLWIDYNVIDKIELKFIHKVNVNAWYI